MAADARTGETTELLQTLIRNRCVNDGSPDSGFESRNADVLQTFLEGADLDVARYEARPPAGRRWWRASRAPTRRRRRCA